MINEKFEKFDANKMTWQEQAEYTAWQLESRMGNKLNKKDFIKWYMQRESTGFRPFDFGLMYQAYLITRKLEDDFDNWTVVSGKEGTGKSTLAINLCKLVSPNFTNDNIVIDATQFNEVFKKANKGDSILLDEGGALLFSRDAMTSDSKFIIKSAMVARAKNVNIVVCIPNFYLVDSYIRDHRVDTLMQVIKRGKYRGFLERGVKTVSREGWKWKNVMTVKVPYKFWWSGDFSKQLSKDFDHDVYLKNKMSYIKEFLEGEAKENKVGKFVAVHKLRKIYNIKSGSILLNMIKRKEIDARKFGALWYVTQEEFMRIGNLFKK